MAVPTAFRMTNRTNSRGRPLSARCRNVQYLLPANPTKVAAMFAMTLEVSGPSPAPECRALVPPTVTPNATEPTMRNRIASPVSSR